MLMMLYVPVSLWSIIRQGAELVAMISMLPLYMLIIQLAISAVGLYEFTRSHGLRPVTWHWCGCLLAYMPYQWLLGYSALRAVWREVRGQRLGEDGPHRGAPPVNAAASWTPR